MSQNINMNIKNIDLYVGYDFNYNQNNLCTLCREDLSMPQETETVSIISVGKCNDIFHKKCIDKLVQTGFISCPVCNMKWEEKHGFKAHCVN